MLKILCCAVAIYALAGVATAAVLLAHWTYDRYAGAYRHRREELPTLWELLLGCVLCWPQVVYLLVSLVVARASTRADDR